MRRLSQLVALLLLPTLAIAQDLAKGYVYDDINGNGKKDRMEKGIAGVAVSDGCNIAVTDNKGYYELPVSRHCVIFVAKPKGYEPAVNELWQPKNYYIHKPDGSPDLKYKGSAPTGELPELLSFGLKKCQDPTDFKFIVFGDPQPYNEKEMEYFRTGIVAEAKKMEGISFGITMGDLVGDYLNLHPLYSKAVSEMQLPWYNVIGNHDRNNYDAPNDKFANETFEANFGPSNYAFRYGDVHFIVLDDIIPATPNGINPYRGGLRNDQLQFVENYIKLVPDSQLVVLAYHVPLVYRSRFDEHQRNRLLNALSRHRVFAISAHTHIQMQNLYGKETGWNGATPFHEFNIGTTCGDWYSGIIDKNGQPDATMRDGTPRGYAIVTVNGNKYEVDYKILNQPADKQMTIYSPKVIPYKQSGRYFFYVNFYTGKQDDKAEYSIDGGEWKKLKPTNEVDPTYMNLIYEWDKVDYALPGSRPGSIPTISTHLWKGDLNQSLNPGEHRISVRMTDLYGRTFTDNHSFKIVE